MKPTRSVQELEIIRAARLRTAQPISLNDSQYNLMNKIIHKLNKAPLGTSLIKLIWFTKVLNFLNSLSLVPLINRIVKRNNAIRVLREQK